MDAALRELSAYARECCHASNVPFIASAPGELPTFARTDFYALIILGAVHELAEGVADEAAVGRDSNATRLARHLMEHDFESSWILKDPEPRMRRRLAEEYRNALERTEGASESLDPDTFEVMDTFLQDVKAEVPKAEWGRYGELVPTFSKMAKNLEAEDDYRRSYQLLSWLSHPGFVFAYKSIAPTSDAGSIKLRFDAAQVTYTFSTLSRAAHSTARCVDRCAPFAGAVLPDDFSHLCAEVRDLNAAVEQAVSAESDPAVQAVVARAMRALKAGEPDQFWFRSDDFTPNQLAAIFRILQLPDPGDSQT